MIHITSIYIFLLVLYYKGYATQCETEIQLSGSIKSTSVLHPTKEILITHYEEIFFFDNRGIRGFAQTRYPGHRAKRLLYMGRVKLRRGPKELFALKGSLTLDLMIYKAPGSSDLPLGPTKEILINHYEE